MKRLIGLLILITAGLACERSTETLGPNLSDLYGEFKLLEEFEVSTNQVDFSVGDNVFFNARFSKTVDWEIQIVGQTSGATKILQGKSKTIDELNSVWNGSTTLLPMFKAESCNAYLSVEEESYYDTLNGIVIDSTRINEGFLLSDFENGVNPGWTVFAQTGADMKFSIIQNDQSPQGSNYYKLGGAVTWDYLIGLIHMPGDAYGDTHFPLAEVPQEVYFNFMLNKPSTISNEIILFQFREDDNEDGIFQEGSEDMYSLELKGIDPEWSLTSIVYSDLVSLVNGAPAPPDGNGIHEPHKLLQVSILFLADPSSGYSETDIDYLIFTEGQALEP